MDTKVKIKRRGKRKYFAIEIPLYLRRQGEGRREVMAGSREALREKYTREIEARKQGLDREAGSRTLAEFLISRFLPFYRSEVEPQTWSDYRLHIESNIVPHLGAIPLERLETRDVDQWMTKLRCQVSPRTGRVLTERTVNYAHAVLRRSLQFAVDWRYIATNPASARMRAVKRRKKLRITSIRFLTPQQSQVLLAAVREDALEALYLLALTTGMREGELFGLTWPDIDVDHSKLTVNRALAYTKRRKGEPGERHVLKAPKTLGSRRTIELPRVAIEALERHARRQKEMKEAAGDEWKEEGFVFTSRKGTPLDPGNALHRFQKLLKKNELPKVRFYDLRHTHASLLIAEGVHAKKIAERLGHASIKLTMDTYGHLFEGSDRESAERMDRMFESRTPERNAAEPARDVIELPRPHLAIHADKNADRELIEVSRRTGSD
jgi:integrase